MNEYEQCLFEAVIYCGTLNKHNGGLQTKLIFYIWWVIVNWGIADGFGWCMKIFTSCTDSSSPLVERPKPTGLRDHRRKNFERAQTVLHHMVERPKPTRSRNHGKKRWRGWPKGHQA